MKTRGILYQQPAKNDVQFIVSPRVREELKPLVFFDAGKFTQEGNGFKVGFHPHSGIGIITYFEGTDLHHRDSGGHEGVIQDGGAQWIRSGGGVWHEEGYQRKPGVEGTWTGAIHQLWLQLPPEWEESEVEYGQLSKEDIPSKDQVKVLVGNYQGVQGRLNPPVNMTYLDVTLSPEESWSFETPPNQTTGFIFVREGDLLIQQEELAQGGMAVLEHNEGKMELMAGARKAKFVVVLAKLSPWPTIASGGQIHTDHEALNRSLERIRNIGRNLL
ncbi:pirin family protein [bacterium SCSIO 12741]|nr:pirin family protein [bacterium SCSIO 12741]